MLPTHEEKLKKIRNLLIELGNDATMALEQALSGLNQLDDARFEASINTLKNAANKGNKIDNEIVLSLALFNAEATDLRELIAYLKATNELIRITDQIKGFSKKISPLLKEGACVSNCKEYASHLCKSATTAVSLAIKAVSETDKDEVRNLYRQVQVEESKTDDLYSILEKNILSELSQQQEFSESHMNILSTVRKLEKIADRAVNIAKLALFAEAGGELNIY